MDGTAHANKSPCVRKRPRFFPRAQHPIPRTRLGNRCRGCVNLGLQAASVSKPDLILLTIELPRMSGYSVCNRIKRDADLKDIPLIILSSESTDQTFEQHRRLGTRAQDYVRKPVTFASLLERVRAFVTISASPVSISPEEDGIVIDDEIELTDDALISAPPLSASLRPIDADIDDFAEHAFGAITSASEKPTTTDSSRLLRERHPQFAEDSLRIVEPAPSGKRRISARSGRRSQTESSTRRERTTAH